MRRNIIIAATTALSTMWLAAPSAHAEAQEITWDCATNNTYLHVFYGNPGDSFVVHTVNCTEGVTMEDTEGTNPTNLVLDPAGEDVTMQIGQLLDLANSVPVWDRLGFGVTYPGHVPPGVLMNVETMEIAADPPELHAGEASDPSGPLPTEHWIGGNESCTLDVEMTDLHVYTTAELEVSYAGTYTLRGVGSDPVSIYLGGSQNPVHDPVLAVYSSFDPANVDDGVVGCNDDLNNQFGYTDEFMVEDLGGGVRVEGHMPYVQVDLTPGTYTVVLFTWEAIGRDDWMAGNGKYAPFTPGAASVYVQMWGPVPFLPTTGSGSTMPLVAAATLVAGGLLATAARRRKVARSVS